MSILISSSMQAGQLGTRSYNLRSTGSMLRGTFVLRRHIWHCDGIVEETMRAYKGNFIRRSGRVNDYFVSKAIDSMAKKPAKLEIMARK